MTMQGTTPNTFDARSQVRFKGLLLFRTFVTPGRLYFIKIGGAKSSAATAGGGGLLPMLIAYFINKNRQKKTAELLTHIEGVPPEQLLGQDALNSYVDLATITGAKIEGKAFWSGVAFGRFSFIDSTAKKRQFTFETVLDMQRAVDSLTQAMGGNLAVMVKWDASKGKFVKAS